MAIQLVVSPQHTHPGRTKSGLRAREGTFCVCPRCLALPAGTQTPTAGPAASCLGSVSPLKCSQQLLPPPPPPEPRVQSIWQPGKRMWCLSRPRPLGGVSLPGGTAGIPAGGRHSDHQPASSPCRGGAEGQDLGASQEAGQDQSLAGLCLQLLASHTPACAPPLVPPSFTRGPKQQQLLVGKAESSQKPQQGEEGRGRGDVCFSVAQARCFLSRAEPFKTGPHRSQRVRASSAPLDGETKAQ